MVRWMFGLACAAAAPALAQCAPEWTALGSGVSQEVQGIAAGLLPHGPRRPGVLYATGAFWAAGGAPAFRNAAWDGARWHDLHSGMESPGNMCQTSIVWSHPEAPVATELYVAGDLFSIGTTPALNVVGWNEVGWHNLGGGLEATAFNAYATSLAEFPDDLPGGPSLVAGGRFDLADGRACNGFARWDGKQWHPPPAHPAKANGSPALVQALCVHDDDGTGPRRPGLYVAGSFDKVGELPARNIARWDGTAWEALGVGVNSTVYSLCAFDDDGPGPRPQALFVSGSFNNAGGAFASKFARWDGASWSAPQGTSLGSNARAMLVWDDDGPGPNGPALYAAGFFSPGVAKWRGVGHAWEPLGGPLSGGIGGVSVGYALCAWDEDGPGPNPGGLYVGGNFTMAGAVPANFIARWGCPLPPGGPCYPDCNQDGTLTLADFGCFTTKFAAADPYADCNSDGALNLADFGCFQTRFALGCP